MILPISSWLVMASPISPSPGTTCNTLSGSTWLSTATRAWTDNGVCSDGFITTVLPIRNDGANCHTEIIIGQFHGPMAPTTPMGTYDRTALPESSSTSTSSSTAKSALARSQASQAPASKRAVGWCADLTGQHVRGRLDGSMDGIGGFVQRSGPLCMGECTPGDLGLAGPGDGGINISRS